MVNAGNKLDSILSGGGNVILLLGNDKIGMNKIEIGLVGD